MSSDAPSAKQAAARASRCGSSRRGAALPGASGTSGASGSTGGGAAGRTVNAITFAGAVSREDWKSNESCAPGASASCRCRIVRRSRTTDRNGTPRASSALAWRSAARSAKA